MNRITVRPKKISKPRLKENDMTISSLKLTLCKDLSNAPVNLVMNFGKKYRDTIYESYNIQISKYVNNCLRILVFQGDVYVGHFLNANVSYVFYLLFPAFLLKY